MSCDYRPQKLFSKISMCLFKVQSRVVIVPTLCQVMQPQIVTLTFLWAGGHTHSGDSASSLRRYIKILWFAPKTTWRSSEKITLSHWPFTIHLIFPLHQFSLFLRFTSLTLTFFFTARLWYPCRYEHRCAVRWDTCVGLIWLNILAKSQREDLRLVRTSLTKHRSSLASRIRGRPPRGLFSVIPLFLNLTITSETVP